MLDTVSVSGPIIINGTLKRKKIPAATKYHSVWYLYVKSHHLDTREFLLSAFEVGMLKAAAISNHLLFEKELKISAEIAATGNFGRPWNLINVVSVELPEGVKLISHQFDAVVSCVSKHPRYALLDAVDETAQNSRPLVLKEGVLLRAGFKFDEAHWGRMFTVKVFRAVSHALMGDVLEVYELEAARPITPHYGLDQTSSSAPDWK